MAEKLTDPKAKQMMLRVSADYMKLAGEGGIPNYRQNSESRQSGKLTHYRNLVGEDVRRLALRSPSLPLRCRDPLAGPL